MGDDHLLSGRGLRVAALDAAVYSFENPALGVGAVVLGLPSPGRTLLLAGPPGRQLGPAPIVAPDAIRGLIRPRRMLQPSRHPGFLSSLGRDHPARAECLALERMSLDPGAAQCNTAKPAVRHSCRT